jgi:pyruvate,water dikinase
LLDGHFEHPASCSDPIRDLVKSFIFRTQNGFVNSMLVFTSMAPPLILPLDRCTDVQLVGGKAAGLARLIQAGFSVPAGICITTEAYQQALYTLGLSPSERWEAARSCNGDARKLALADCQSLVRTADVSRFVTQCLEWMPALDRSPAPRWAVRSSATNEDSTQASFAGLYRTRLGVASSDLGAAIVDLWASIWDVRVMDYVRRAGRDMSCPAMAVVIQPMLDAQAAGVAYSIHPLTGRANQVMVNAVRGLGAPLVDGRVTPNQFVVEVDGQQPTRIRTRTLANQIEQLVVTEAGVRTEAVAEAQRTQPVLSDEQLFTLARTAKQIERTFHHPVDCEWVVDAKGLWIVQARPITTVTPSLDFTNDDCEWSRVNFKETMPELPSPLGLSFLEYFMDAYILSHYRRLGCRIPDGLASVRVLHGRPYLNVTLFYSLVGQLGGDPSLNREQMGGEPVFNAPPVARIGWLAYLRAGWLMLSEMRRCAKQGPIWFAEMKQLAATYHSDRIRQFSLDELATRLDDLGRWLDRREVTFGIAAAVGQCLQTFNLLLPRWLGTDWRSLLNAALQGQGTVISAQQILRLAELARAARGESAVQQWLLEDPWEPANFRECLAGTAFLRSFDRYLEGYGHRAVGESDVASPRLAEQPLSILALLRTQLRAPGIASPSEILARQKQNRRKALVEIRRRFGRRWDRRAVFLWWYRRLARFFSLREANRHHLMYYSTAARNLLLRAGELLVAEGRLETVDDIFFVTLDERTRLLAREERDWKELVSSRRAERQRQSSLQVPDTIRDWDPARLEPFDSSERSDTRAFRGIPISTGVVTGPARLVSSAADWHKVQAGDIIIAPVIDPGMAPLFSIAAGLVVEMGGTLSHGAIMAREYGLPAVANVGRVMIRVKDGDRVTVDAGSGDVITECVSGN